MQRKGVQSAPRKWGKATAIEQVKFIAIAFKHLSDPLTPIRVVTHIENFDDHDRRPPLIVKKLARSPQYAEFRSLHIHFQNICFRIRGNQVVQRVGWKRHGSFFASVDD